MVTLLRYLMPPIVQSFDGFSAYTVPLIAHALSRVFPLLMGMWALVSSEPSRCATT